MISNKVDYFRDKHPKFIYQGFTWDRYRDVLQFRFLFKLQPDIVFSPVTRIEGVNWSRVNSLDKAIINNLIFHLGLIEMLSYWKAACSPQIIVAAGPLTSQQISWWKDLILHGMSEFFYRNEINFLAPDFLDIYAPTSNNEPSAVYSEGLEPGRHLILTSGGKDSSVTLQFFQEAGKDFNSLLLNPTPAAAAITALASCRHPIIVRRSIDPYLLELNAAGYLNGHTPFSAYLAFLGVMCAILFGYDQIIVSNERSANSPNVKYLGMEVNHQYSKSYRFECKFRSYVNSFISPSLNYFSLLRPLYELQIARLFASYPQYFNLFKSCNQYQQTNSWCGRCPKCLFTYITLYPFLPQDSLLRIFGEDLFADDHTLPIIYQLLGIDQNRPFECVGTEGETLAALYLCLQRVKRQLDHLPRVLAHVETVIFPKHPNLLPLTHTVLSAWEEKHNLPLEYADLLKQHLNNQQDLWQPLALGIDKRSKAIE